MESRSRIWLQDINHQKSKSTKMDCPKGNRLSAIYSNMKCSGENVIICGIFSVGSCFSQHFMLYRGNFDCLSNSDSSLYSYMLRSVLWRSGNIWISCSIIRIIAFWHQGNIHTRSGLNARWIVVRTWMYAYSTRILRIHPNSDALAIWKFYSRKETESRDHRSFFIWSGPLMTNSRGQRLRGQENCSKISLHCPVNPRLQ